MIRSVAAISAAVVLSAVAITPANARSAPLPQGQSAWLTPANVKPYAGFYADLQGTTLTVAYLSTYSTTCSTGTMMAENTAAMTSSVNGVHSTWTMTRTGRQLLVVSQGPVYSSEVTYMKYPVKKAAKLLKQGRKGSTVGKELLARCWRYSMAVRVYWVPTPSVCVSPDAALGPCVLFHSLGPSSTKPLISSAGGSMTCTERTSVTLQ